VDAAAAEVGGDAIALTVLLQPGAEAHDFEMTLLYNARVIHDALTAP
jgi:ABC-type Zn uptake system ZnuABC Zn-binding protein ZnuA